MITNLERRYKETESEYIRTELEKFMIQKPCPSCHGKRLRPEILAVTVNGRNVADVSGMSVTDALDWAKGLAATVTEREADHRPPGAQGDLGPARFPGSTWAWTT